VPAVFGQVLLGRLAAGFAKAHPEVNLEVTMEDRAVDLVTEGYDVVVRLNPRPDSTLVGKCFVRDQLLIVASPPLAKPSGPGWEGDRELPVVVRTALQHDAVWKVPAPDGPEVRTRTVLELPTLPTVRDAVLTGIGAAKLPRVLVADDLAAGKLVSWGAATERPAELWALHSSGRLPSAKVKAFLRHLEAEFPGEWL
jgi:DNA-binding transcriptional LysR family regulator